MVCLAGYLLYLLVEAPFSNLLTEFVTRKKGKESVELAGSKSAELTTRQFSKEHLGKEHFGKDENENSIRGIVRKEVAEEKKIH